MAEATTKVVTNPVRLSYANLFRPVSFQGGDPKYSVVLMIPKSDTQTIAKIRAAQKAAAELGAVSKFGGKVPAKVKTTLKDADVDVNLDGEVYAEANPEYAGHYIMNVSSKNKPGIVDKDMNEIIEPGEVYSGCWARVSINAFAYNAQGNKGVSCGLNNVQKIRDDEAFSGGTSADEDFEQWSGEGDADLLG